MDAVGVCTANWVMVVPEMIISLLLSHSEMTIDHVRVTTYATYKNTVILYIYTKTITQVFCFVKSKV